MKPKVEAKKKPGLGKKDVGLIAAKAVISAVPFGGPIAQILSGFKPSYADQLIRDVEDIDGRLADLEKKIPSFNVKALEKDESFKATIANWVQIALRTSDKEKRETLRNAVVNSAMKNPPEEDLRPMFFNFIDDLTPWHLKLLVFFDDPLGFAQKRNLPTSSLAYGSVSSVLYEAFPELKQRSDFVEQIMRDLSSKGLIKEVSIHTLVSAAAMFASRTTPMGKQFLSFITSTDDSNQSGPRVDSTTKRDDASKN